MLEKLKLRLGQRNNEDDEVLLLLLDQAAMQILSYTNRTIITQQLEPVQLELATIYFNQLGLEGEKSRSEGGIWSSFETPENILSRLDHFRMLKAWKIANES